MQAPQEIAGFFIYVKRTTFNVERGSLSRQRIVIK